MFFVLLHTSNAIKETKGPLKENALLWHLPSVRDVSRAAPE